VIVAGADGPVGRLICREVLRHSHGVTAMIAEAVDAPDFRAMGCDVIVADTRGRVTGAFDGADACIIADGLPRSEKRREIGLLDQNAVMNVIDGAEERLPRTGRANVPQADTAEAGVGRVVLLSFLDPTRFEGEPAGEQRFHRTIRGDRRLMECPLAWSIIRPGEIVTQGHGSGRIDASTDLKSWREIEAGDVARTAVHALLTGDADRKSIEITGGQTPIPEAVRTA